jgi:Type IV secretion-system coupling protein DNA-binding domain
VAGREPYENRVMLRQTVLPPALANNTRHSKAAALFTVCAVLVATFPGTLIGAGIAFVLWRITRPDIATRWLVAGLSAATAVALQPAVEIIWSWSLLVQMVTPSNPSHFSAGMILASLPAEMLLGPLVLVAFELGVAYRRQTIHGEEWARYNQVASRKRALESDLPAPDARAANVGAQAHPSGKIRLGVSAEGDSPFDLDAQDVAQHIFIPGASGTGKTTTLVRLADGALANGYGVVIIDCKGVGLGREARKLASRHDVPFTIVDPQDASSIGYDPCSGDAPTIANKLIGSFSFAAEAEIYKQVAMEVIPVICRAMVASGSDVTLDGIYAALGRGGLARLGRNKGAEAYRDRLEELETSGRLSTAGYVGLQKRLGALMEGAFGELFRKCPALNWPQEMHEPRVTYLSLSSTAASEDVELFGRVITQDLKQVCDQRMRAIERGDDPIPVLIIYDEFAALREAQQVVDLLLQARQARAPLVVATQYLPEELAIRKPVLSAGVLIVHRLEAEDADLMAAQFGTHSTTALTAQLDYETGWNEKGSVRWVEEFDMHPNVLKELPVGMAAVLARRTRRKSLVRIAPTL